MADKFSPGTPDTARILVIDDEPKFRDAIAAGLRMEDWLVTVAATGAEALACLTRDTFDLLLLDWMLPDCDGIEVLAHARARGVQTPVLMVTARGTLDDRVDGIEHGADDYLVKPFAFAELLARCRALLRRQSLFGERELRCADLVLDARARVARRGAETIALTPLELDVLEYLLRRRDQIVTREMLAREVWMDPAQTASLGNAINIHVARLRQKIDHGDAPRLIHTLHGIGYRLGLAADEAPARRRLEEDASGMLGAPVTA